MDIKQALDQAASAATCAGDLAPGGPTRRARSVGIHRRGANVKPLLPSAPLTPEDEGCWLMTHSEYPPGRITVRIIDAYLAADRRDAEIMLALGDYYGPWPKYGQAFKHITMAGKRQ